MAMVTTTCCIDQIGETAGAVWRFLDENGTTSLSKLTKSMAAPRDLVMQAVGWLAREGKVDVEETRRGRVIALKP